MEAVHEFLKLNGFKPSGISKFSNDKCEVVIHLECYQVLTEKSGEKYIWQSRDGNIYALIGYLTYYGLMDKNYKQLTKKQEG